MNSENTVRVLVTGAAGQIGYALLPRLVSGEVFGPHTRVDLRLVEIPEVVERLHGTRMELEDCAFPLLGSVWSGSDIDEAAEGADWALLLGSVPRGIVYKGKKLVERSDLLEINGQIFVGQGRAIGTRAKPDCRVLVVGNPANTNCLIGWHNAAASGQTWMGMMALDANRARALLAARLGCAVGEVRRMIVWGNHSPTMVPDAANAQVRGRSVAELIGDASWLEGEFLSLIQQRGKAVIDARGASSAFSAANAALDTVRSIHNGTAPDDCLSVAPITRGDYDLPPNLCCGLPISAKSGQLSVVPDLPLDDRTRQLITASISELQQERDSVAHLLP